MDYKQTVEWLKSYRDMYYKVQYIDNKMQGIKAISYSDEAVGGTRKTIDDYLAEKEELEAKMKKIEDAIHSIPDLKQRTVLEYKYLEFMSFGKISKFMNYSFSQITRYHKSGIKKILKR